MSSFFRAFIAGLIAALAYTWRLVRTPVGWLWQKESVPVTPAQVVAAQERGRVAVEAYDGAAVDSALRYYLGWRLNAEHPSRGGRPADDPAPSLDAVPPDVAHWARSLEYREVRAVFAGFRPPSDLLHHLRADKPVLPGVPLVKWTRSRPVAVPPPAAPEKATAGGRGAGGGPRIQTPESQPSGGEADMEAAVSELLNDLGLRLGGPSAPRPR